MEKIEIKFRGLRTDGKGWVYGYVFMSRFETAIQYGFKKVIQVIKDDFTYDCYEVIPESIGVFIGINDKNYTDMYTGDVIRFPTLYENPEMTATGYSTSHIVFVNGAFFLNILDGKYDSENTLYEEMKAYDGNFEVIGNIYENPELIVKP